MLENDGENIGSDNEILMGVKCDYDGMLVYINKSERKWRESILVGGLQGVNFSLNVVEGGEVKASRVFRKDESSSNVYLEDDRSANRFPWVFCALHRWCSNYELVSPAYIERESVAWCYSERYIERERYCERKREVEIFKVNRNYEEFVERLGGERSNNNNKYLPYSETEIVETMYNYNEY